LYFNNTIWLFGEKKPKNFITSEEYGDIYNEENATKQLNYNSKNCNRLIIGVYEEPSSIINKNLQNSHHILKKKSRTVIIK